MKWLNRKTFSRKSLAIGLSLSLVILIAANFALSTSAVNSATQSVAQKAHEHKKSKAVKKSKKSVHVVKKIFPKKKTAKKIVKHDKRRAQVEAQRRLAALKRPLKLKQRLVAHNSTVKMRPAADLSADHWNLDHEQVDMGESRRDDDPAGAEAFEDHRLTEEMKAAGI